MKSHRTILTDPNPIRLVVNADDFGETENTTAAINDCIEAGVVTSTTIMSNMPGTSLALRLAAGTRAGRASFGVHLNLCEGRPLTRPLSIMDRDGNFVSKRLVATKALLARVDLAQVEVELRAQIERIKDAGVRISHLDSHKHLHQLPGISQIIINLADEFQIERIRCTLEHESSLNGGTFSAGVSRFIRVRLARRMQTQLDRRKLRYPQRTFDVSELMRLPSDLDRVGFLRTLQPTAEMFCHPGAAEPGENGKGSSSSRLQEQNFLMSGDFATLIERARITLGTFWDI